MTSRDDLTDDPLAPLTADQLEMWEIMKMDRPIKPSPRQTREQALNFAVVSFQYGCSLEVDPPSDLRILTEFVLRGVAVLDSPSGVDRGSLGTPPEIRERYPGDWDFERFGCPTIYRMVWDKGVETDG